MTKNSIIISIVLFALVVAGMFSYSYYYNSNTSEQHQEETRAEVVDEVDTYGITSIDAVHYYIDGVHTVVGELVMPTPCDLVDVSTQVRESFPEQIVFDFVVINEADMCAQVLTTQRFRASAEASEEASLTATFMGKPVTLNLIPAPEGAVPEEFEVYIKG